MKKQPNGTGQSKAFAVEIGQSWKRWAKSRSDDDLHEVNHRLSQLKESFGSPHTHGGLGVRHLKANAFEFRISRGLRVIFLLLKPRTLRLMMIGNHDEVRAWIKENL